MSASAPATRESVVPGPDGWVVPTPPHPPGTALETASGGVRGGVLGVTEVREAYLTPVRRGELRTLQAPTRWHRGAVHDAQGQLVVASQKIGGLEGSQAAPADPGRVRVPPGARRLEGTWLYGGHWIQHFGHFFTETVTTLWPEVGPVVGTDLDEDPVGTVFHSYMSRFRGVGAWQRELLALAGGGERPAEVVEDEGLRVERLLVPDRSVVVNGWAHPEARAVWRRMVLAAGGGTGADPDGERLFFSRTAFNEAKRAAGRRVRTDPARDVLLDETFAAAGFRVLAPETLHVVEQVRLASRASMIAGGAGTALHLAAFAPPGTHVLEVGDTRSPTVMVPLQLVVDAVCEHPTAFLPFDVDGPRLPQVLDRLLAAAP